MMLVEDVVTVSAPVIVGAAVASNEWEMSSSDGINEEAFVRNIMNKINASWTKKKLANPFLVATLQ
jgi:hypothetical protein